MTAILIKGDKLENGHYSVIKELGVGGMGVVYHCRDELLMRDVAIKMLLPELMADKNNLEIFKQEARLAAKLEHPNIVTVYDIGVEERQSKKHHYVAMEYLPGGNLANQIASEPLNVEHSLNWMKQLAAGLSFAHKRGVIHQDIKADNIFITTEGDLKIGDFGLARLMAGRVHLNEQTKGMGTPAYMSPELCRGDAQDERSDTYSMGVLFFEMATGQLPYRAQGMIEMAMKHSTAAIPSARRLNANVPEILEKLIKRMMAKQPDERFKSMSEVLTILDDLIFEMRVARLGIGLNVRPTMRSNSGQTEAPAVTEKPAQPQEAGAKATVSPVPPVKEERPKTDTPKPDKAKISTSEIISNLWTFKSDGPIGWASQPILSRDEKTLFVSSCDGSVYALDLQGQANWSFSCGSPILGAPSLSDDKVIVASSDGAVFALSQKEGKLIWKRNLAGALVSTPAIDKNLALVAAMDGKITALDSKSGEVRWHFTADGAITSAPQQHGDAVLFGTRGGTFFALQSNNGTPLWKFSADGPVVGCASASVDAVYFGTQLGTFYAVEAQGGRLIWEYPTDREILSKCVISFTSVIFGSYDKWLYCCEKYDGSLKWKSSLRGRVMSPLVLRKNQVISATREGWIQAFAVNTGQLAWQQDIKCSVEAGMLVTPDHLYVGSLEGEITSWAENGKV